MKFEDRIDNIRTIDAMEPEKRTRKIRETEKWFPIFEERLRVLISKEVTEMRLPKKWLLMPTVLGKALTKALKEKEMYAH